MEHIDWVFVGRIALAAFLGYVIGWEREFRGKPAGERTFALIALGAAAFTALGVEQFPASAEKVIAGVITGVGFLGAGLIFRSSDRNVSGLTTAASAWAAAAVGVLAGAGDYWVALFTTALILLLLESNFLPFVKALDARRQQRRDED